MLEFLVISCGLLVYFIARFIQYLQVNTASGDNITHLLFHNLAKKKYKTNPWGIVGSGSINLPTSLYRFTSIFFKDYSYGQFSTIASANLLLVLAIEVILFIYLASQYESFGNRHLIEIKLIVN